MENSEHGDRWDVPELRGPLEGMRLQTFINHFESLTVPRDVPADDFGREVLRMSYVAGFSTALLLAERIRRERPDSWHELVELFKAQAMALAAKHDGERPS